MIRVRDASEIESRVGLILIQVKGDFGRPDMIGLPAKSPTTNFAISWRAECACAGKLMEMSHMECVRRRYDEMPREFMKNLNY